MSAKIIVTGASGSMGAVAAEALARQGHVVVMACRNPEKAAAVRADILSRVPGAFLEIRQLELSSMASVRDFAAGFSPGEITALFNNAGVISRAYALTSDGLEHTFAVNYFGPFLLTSLLLPCLKPEAHVVNMVSLTCRFVRVDEASLCPSEKDFSQLGTYARSKLALLHFSQELARRHPELCVNVADPGVVNSGIISMGRWFDPLADVLFRPLIKSPEKGAIPPLAALASPARGRYFVGTRSKEIPACYRDADLQGRLWEATERLL